MLKTISMLTTLSILVIGCLVAIQRQTTASERANEPADSWHVTGALSEACTCNVPCTCNFGEGPSPHPYCYVTYSYEIREGHFNGIKLDGLRFGGMETAKGNAMYLDARAEGEQRRALEAVARKAMRVKGDRMGGGKFLGLTYVQIMQEYDGRSDTLDLGGLGGFKTRYIMGRDKTKPVVVVNNTEWPIKEAIKGKTEYFSIKDNYGNVHTARNTNSNHGDFDFDENTRFGSLSCGSSCSTDTKAGEKAHKH